MARHLSVGSVIEKNKIQSDELFLILIEARIKDDETGALVSTLYFVKNSENVVFGGNTYVASNFEIDISVENNTEPSIKMTAQDQTRTLGQYVERYAGLVGSEVTMRVVNSGALNAPPEIEEDFKVTTASINEFVVEIELGTESVVNKRFPSHRQFKDRCSWPYKGNRCKYAGPLAKCDFTLLGSNGCAAHNNVRNYGGFPGINTQL